MTNEYVPMTDNQIEMLWDKASYVHERPLYRVFANSIEQAVLARIAEQGLVIVPKDDAERVELLNVLRHHIEYGDYQASQQDLLVRIHMHLEKGGA